MDSRSVGPDWCTLRKLTLLSDSSSESDGDVSSLHAAAYGGRGDLVQYLLASGTEVNGRDSDGRTPLHVAVCRSRTSPRSSEGSIGSDPWDDSEIIKMLLSYGAKVNATNGGKRTALHFAASSGKKELVELLLDNGAESWHRDEDGANALDLARAAGHSGVISPLCQAEEKIFQRLQLLEAECAELRQGQQEGLAEFRQKIEAIERLLTASPSAATPSNHSD